MFVSLIFVFFQTSHFSFLLDAGPLTDEWDGLAGLGHPLSDGQHEHREGKDHLEDLVVIN